MRQYRGLTNGGVWVYGDVLHLKSKVYILDGSNGDGILDFRYTEVLPETVGQQLDIDVSGLRHGADKLVFWEGDIIECRHGHKGIIVYDNCYEGGGCFYHQRFEGFDGEGCDTCEDTKRWYYYKVIGNIWEKQIAR